MCTRVYVDGDALANCEFTCTHTPHCFTASVCKTWLGMHMGRYNTIYSVCTYDTSGWMSYCPTLLTPFTPTHTHIVFSTSPQHTPAIPQLLSGLNGSSIVLALSPPSSRRLCVSRIFLIGSLHLSLSQKQHSLWTRCRPQRFLIECPREQSCLATLTGCRKLLQLSVKKKGWTQSGGYQSSQEIQILSNGLLCCCGLSAAQTAVFLFFFFCLIVCFLASLLSLCF